MPNFRVHVLSGLLLFPLTLPVYGLLQNLLYLEPISERIIALSFVFFTLGSDAPDLDHKNAYMHRIAKVVVWVLTTIYFYFFLKERIPVWFPEVRFLENEMIQFYFSLFLGMLCSQLFSALMPRHRGPFHSFLAPFVFGIIIGGLFYFLEIKAAEAQLTMSNSIYVGTSAFLGYTVHLILDYSQSYFKSRSCS
ncbi:MAG TPA: metal-dependent hydrolase [Thermotogota bacterium]|nr:metal-dependent hydrolase [Thermotogota bacterium]HPJ88270.1 metal-dependent hydrolase [Thermotogota bacterium]HPR96746.1 metal-dependent hydrolase [Thermotogota bacterium]